MRNDEYKEKAYTGEETLINFAKAWANVASGDEVYFDTISAIANGDLAEITSHGSAIIYGRTDNTLNPGGVRIGTAEIYNICERLKEIDDCLVFGNRINNDEEIILCIKFTKNNTLDESFSIALRKMIRVNTSPWKASNDKPKPGKEGAITVKAKRS